VVVAVSHLSLAQARSAGDPPLLIPWNRIGNIALGESKARVEREYGSVGHGYHVIQRDGNTVRGYYRLHGDRVIVTFYGNRVGELEFHTPYYRTNAGFGVGSRIPLGPCHTTATNPCEHRWRGFIYNPTLRVRPCNCWVKAGPRGSVAPRERLQLRQAVVLHLPPPWSRCGLLLCVEVRRLIQEGN
jgi:hypothetical protein